jgi:soluble lytic murein transglycosylase-like protein
MSTAADTLVAKHPTRISQLTGPVKDFLTVESKRYLFNGTDQDLYMAIFVPTYRRKPTNQELPADVQKANKPIKTSGDYVALVNNHKLVDRHLTPEEYTALKDTASSLGINWKSLYKQIDFESGWDPKARNSIGARGLIQFTPKTAKGMGYKEGVGIGVLLLLAGISFFAWRKYGNLRR